MSIPTDGGAATGCTCIMGTNPFWQLACRRLARRGDVGAWLGPLSAAVVIAAVWRWGAVIEGDWPYRSHWSQGRWHLVLGAHALVIAAGLAPAAWRCLGSLSDEANRLALRLSRLTPARLVLHLAAEPLVRGGQILVAGLPVYVVLRQLEGPSTPPPGGLLLVLGCFTVVACFLMMGVGAASARMRQASIDDWGDVLFNARTLVAWFLNPFWILVGCVVVMRVGPRLAGELAAGRPWFGVALPGLTLPLVLLPWILRQALGLATGVHGEEPRLAGRVVAGWTVFFVVLALYQVGCAWEPWLANHALAIWWELAANAGDSQRLLAFFLTLAAFPLAAAAAYAEALRSGLRSADRRDVRLPGARALASLLAAGLAVLAVPAAAWLAAVLLGGWSPGAIGVAYPARLALLWAAAVTSTTAYLAALMLLAQRSRTAREFGSIAVLAPLLAGPFILGPENTLLDALASLSPFVALLWMAPTAGTAVGLTSEIPLPFTAAGVAVTQLLAGGLGLLACGAALRRLRETEFGDSAGPALWWRRFDNPLFGLDLLTLQRHGSLWTPFGMVLLPVLALAFARTGTLAAGALEESCWLFVWTGRPDWQLDALGSGLIVVLATLGVQFLIHPASLAGIRGFGRDEAAGRLESLVASPLSARQLVAGRYLAVLTPFALFLACAWPAVLLHGALAGLASIATAGLLHWTALAVVLPAAALAGSVDREWRGQGLGLGLGLEAARHGLGMVLGPETDPRAGALLGALLLVALATLLTPWYLNRAVRRLAGAAA